MKKPASDETSTHTAELEILKMLPPQARKGDLFPALNNTSLISIGMLADAGCKTTFDKDYCIVKHNNKEILCGNRCPYTKLWQISLRSPTNARKNLMEMSNNPQANALINKHSKIKNLVVFSHQALFSPRIRTLQAALDNNRVRNFPGLTAQTFKKHAPNSVATAKGHLDQIRANVNSTKPKENQETEEDIDADYMPEPLPKGKVTNACYAAVKVFETTGQVHSDQTGKFPVTSSKGMKYMLIVYAFDSNSIHPVPLRSRTAESILDA